jgi:hypothetical protein
MEYTWYIRVCVCVCVRLNQAHDHLYLYYLNNLFFKNFLVGVELNLGLCVEKADAVLLEPHLHSIWLCLIWWWGVVNYFDRLASNHGPPDLSLQVARFTDVSHMYLAYFLNSKVLFEVLGWRPGPMYARQAFYHWGMPPPSFMVRFKYCSIAYLEPHNIQLMTELFPLLYNRSQRLFLLSNSELFLFDQPLIPC